MRMIPAVLVICSALAASAAAAADEAELRALLDDFLAGASRSDIETHQRFWAEDLVYTSSAGLRFGKAEILEGMRSADPESDLAPDEQDDQSAAPGPKYRAEDVEIRIFDGTAVVTFVLVASEDSGAQTLFFNTGVFRQRDEQWQAIAWQATRAADPAH